MEEEKNAQSIVRGLAETMDEQSKILEKNIEQQEDTFQRIVSEKNQAKLQQIEISDNSAMVSVLTLSVKTYIYFYFNLAKRT